MTRFAISAAVDRALFAASGGSYRYLAIRLDGERGGGSSHAARPRNIALAIDASGSMSGAKLRAAKHAALGLVGRLGADDRLTLVSFASDVVVHLDGVAAGPEQQAEIARAIATLETRGSTNLAEGWFAAVDRAAAMAERDPRLTARVILLSDGHANEGLTDRDALAGHAAELRRRGVLTSALGIGDGYDEQLLRGIAEAGGGRLHDAELAEEIESVLLGELDDIDSIALEDVELELALPEGFAARMLGRGGSVPQAGRLVCPIGALQHKITRTAVFQLVCPPAAPGTRVALTVSARGTAAADGARLVAAAPDVILCAAAGADLRAQPRDRHVAVRVARAWLADLVGRAAALNRDGAHREAAEMVAGQLRHFRRYAGDLPGGPEMIDELEILAARAHHELSPRLAKEMVLSTELMLAERRDFRPGFRKSWADRIRRGE
jgi:Ca-activated chloride channel family protein